MQRLPVCFIKIYAQDHTQDFLDKLPRFAILTNGPLTNDCIIFMPHFPKPAKFSGVGLSV